MYITVTIIFRMLNIDSTSYIQYSYVSVSNYFKY